MKHLKSVTLLFGLALALPLSAQTRPPPAPVSQGQLIEITATVEDADPAKRVITIKRPERRVVISQVDPR